MPQTYNFSSARTRICLVASVSCHFFSYNTLCIVLHCSIRIVELLASAYSNKNQLNATINKVDKQSRNILIILNETQQV